MLIPNISYFLGVFRHIPLFKNYIIKLSIYLVLSKYS